MPILNNPAAAAGKRVFNERRGTERRRSFKGGLLRFNGGYGALECIVRNQSDGGARLSFGDVMAVPPQFELKVGPEGAWRAASIRWRKGMDIGIAYL